MTQTISHHTHNIYIRKEFGVPEYSDIHTLIFESRSILSRLAHDETTNFIFLQQARSKYLTPEVREHSLYRYINYITSANLFIICRGFVRPQQSKTHRTFIKD